MNVPVSVIIPCYCSANTIIRAVNSVAKQTLKPAELIIVDDGSDDGTREVLKQLQTQYGEDWIKLAYLNSNNGPSVARNTGWELATQEYIAFLDADDAWHPDKIAVQYSWMRENPDFVLTTNTCIVSKTDDVILDFKIPESLDVNLVSKYQILISNKFYTPCVMLKKNVQHRFHSSKKYCEDYLLWLEIILTGGKAAILNYPMTFLFKEYFGESGLSSNLWAMEINELQNYAILWKKKYIWLLEMCIFMAWSWSKYLRRLGIVNVRKMTKNISAFSINSKN